MVYWNQCIRWSRKGKNIRPTTKNGLDTIKALSVVDSHGSRRRACTTAGNCRQGSSRNPSPRLFLALSIL